MERAQCGGVVGAFGSLLLEESGGVEAAPPVPWRQFEPCPAAEPILSGAQFTGSSPVGARVPLASARWTGALDPLALWSGCLIKEQPLQASTSASAGMMLVEGCMGELSWMLCEAWVLGA